MNNKNQDIEQKIENKKLTVKQLELQLKRLEQQQNRAKEKLARQIEREREKEQKATIRKTRNKKIYDWGGLVPMTFGVENFDRICDNTEIKKVLIGLLLKTKNELINNGFGLTEDNKPNWLEFYKNVGSQFLDEQNNGTK